MVCLSLHRVRCVFSNCISSFYFSPGNSRETLLFGGPDPNRSNMHESTKDSSLSAKNSVPIRLHTVRIWFHPNGLTLMEDIKRRGLDDVVFDAIALQELGDQHEAFLVDLAVLEVGISRVLGKYGITKFVPLSGDDPIILQQPVEDLDSKKALCYQHLHSKYLQEYAKRCKLGKVLGFEIHNVLKDWYKERLEDICNRFRKLGYC